MLTRGRSEWLRTALVVGLAVACGVVTTLVPDWERDLHAQVYEEFSSLASEALQDAEDERRRVANRLEQSRREGAAFLDTSTECTLATDCQGQSGRRDPARRWGIFLTFNRNTVRRSRSQRENGFDSQTPGFLLGVDRRLSDALLLGMAAGFKVTDLSFDEVPRSEDFHDSEDPRDPHQLGRQRTYTGTAGPYLSYTPGQAWYLNASLLVGLLAASTERSGDGLEGTARGNTTGYRVSLAGGGGYDWRYRALRVGPRLNVAWDLAHVDGFNESGQHADMAKFLRVSDIEKSLVTLKAGARASYALGFSWGTLVPNWRLDFVYRDLGRSEEGNASLLDRSNDLCRDSGDGRCVFKFPLDRPDRTSMEVGLGLQFALPHQLTFWIDYEENFLERFFIRSRVTVGVRKQF